jgi:hypothetical protein
MHMGMNSSSSSHCAHGSQPSSSSYCAHGSQFEFRFTPMMRDKKKAMAQCITSKVQFLLCLFSSAFAC